MPLEITGKLHQLFETQAVTDRFNKREFVVELPGRHPQRVMFQLTGKRCGDLDGFARGEEVRIEFTLRGREWTSRQGEVRYFNSLEVTRLELLARSPKEPGESDESGESGESKRAAIAADSAERDDSDEPPF